MNLVYSHKMSDIESKNEILFLNGIFLYGILFLFNKCVLYDFVFVDDDLKLTDSESD